MLANYGDDFVGLALEEDDGTSAFGVICMRRRQGCEPQLDGTRLERLAKSSLLSQRHLANLASTL